MTGAQRDLLSNSVDVRRTGGASVQARRLEGSAAKDCEGAFRWIFGMPRFDGAEDRLPYLQIVPTEMEIAG
jgi:hypothetical protein